MFISFPFYLNHNFFIFSFSDGVSVFSQIFSVCSILLFHFQGTIFLFSEVDQTVDELTEEIQKAHVICLVYSVVDDASIDRLSSHWLPFLRNCLVDTCLPIVLVGNKVDLVDYSTVEVRLYLFILTLYSSYFIKQFQITIKGQNYCLRQFLDFWMH